jgi:hypothetical protein
VFPFTTQRNLTLIGNAVPPILAHVVAKSIARFIRAIDSGEDLKGAVTNKREYILANQNGWIQGELGL